MHMVIRIPWCVPKEVELREASAKHIAVYHNTVLLYSMLYMNDVLVATVCVTQLRIRWLCYVDAMAAPFTSHNFDSCLNYSRTAFTWTYFVH